MAILEINLTSISKASANNSGVSKQRLARFPVLEVP